MKGVALTQPPHRKQAATQGAMPFEARDRIPGARRLEPADVAQHRREHALVDAYQGNEKLGYHEVERGET